MSRFDIDRRIAHFDALGGPGLPLSERDEEERERLIAERDDTRWDVQKKMRVRDAHMGRARISLMQYELEVDRASLRALVRESWLSWRPAMDDYEMRHAPGKPKRHLSDNWNPRDDVYDYGDDAGAGFDKAWDTWWRENYSLPPGRPWPAGQMPTKPLYGVFYRVWAWCKRHRNKATFDPPFQRLFLKVAQALDKRYTAEDCAKVYENCRK